MNKSIGMFLLGVVITLTVGFGTIKSDILVMKPATPKLFSVHTVSTSMSLDEYENLITIYMKKGYVIHSSVAYSSSYVTVVFVKY